MRIFKWKDDKIVNLLNKKIRSGGVILASTDTVLGRLAPLTEIGFKRLAALKKRHKKSYLVIIGSFLDLAYFVPQNEIDCLSPFLRAIWPGPVTVIFTTKQTAMNEAIDIGPTIALRLPAHEPLAQLAHLSGGLFSTSANITGEPVPSHVDGVDQSIIKNVDAIVLNDAHSTDSEVAPSTIIDVSQGQFVLVRAGLYDSDDLTTLYAEMVKICVYPDISSRII